MRIRRNVLGQMQRVLICRRWCKVFKKNLEKHQQNNYWYLWHTRRDYPMQLMHFFNSCQVRREEIPNDILLHLKTRFTIYHLIDYNYESLQAQDICPSDDKILKSKTSCKKKNWKKYNLVRTIAKRLSFIESQSAAASNALAQILHSPRCISGERLNFRYSNLNFWAACTRPLQHSTHTTYDTYSYSVVPHILQFSSPFRLH